MTRIVVRMTIDEVGHLTPDDCDTIRKSYPPHEIDARTKGLPQLGSGRVFPVSEEQISIEPFQPPDYWPQIGALDYGYEHPFGAVRIAHDEDNDVAYVIQTYRQRQATPVIHAAALRAWGEGLPFAWPHDGMSHDKQSGIPLRDAYVREKLRLLPTHAPMGVEFGIMEMLDRMLTGRLKVFSHLAEWFDEFRLYHRKDGMIVKKEDDLLAATRCGIVCLRHARVFAGRRGPGPEKTEGAYDPAAW